MEKPWTLSCDDILKTLDVDPEQGLSSSEAIIRRKRFGKNLLRQARKKSTWLILAEQFKSLIAALLIVASALSFAFGDWPEGIAIIIVIIISAAIGFFTEIKAIRSMEALRRLSHVEVTVRRNGEICLLPAHDLVPGDIVILQGGDIITADLRLLEASKLQADESTLTGESVPVSKSVDILAEDTLLAERANLLFKGTAVTRGSAEAVVIATGMNTELGRISALVEKAEKEATPLEKRLDQLAHNLIWVTLAITALIAALGIFRGRETILMIETAIALAVAAIPEGLPIVATIALARGMLRMAQRNALINRLAAVETLGATNIICTDKTGTLTENKMAVTRLLLHSGEVEVKSHGPADSKLFAIDNKTVEPSNNNLLSEALKIGVLCNNASINPDADIKSAVGIGDPLEVALLEAGIKAGIDRNDLVNGMPEEREESFDAETKLMATYHKENGQYYVAVKGAPECVLENCASLMTSDGQIDMTDTEREKWISSNTRLAADGLRMLGLAMKKTDDIQSDPYRDLVFVGLAALSDPPREDVREAIDICQAAGIRVIMVTGDQAATARNIAFKVGLVDDEKSFVMQGQELRNINLMAPREKEQIVNQPIFARVSPKEKLDLITVHQKNGSVVAMTGDGVNDAPALKKADIGIAMGQRGTQVAREAADMVLKDDAFSSIVEAVKQGRVIFDNIRKFVLYLLSCNVSEIMAVAGASMANFPLPILPLQILFLNIVTDVFPALALGVGEGEPGIMQRPSRSSKEPILTRRHWYSVGIYGLIISASVLAAFILALRLLKMNPSQAVTVSFLTLAFAQLLHVFNMRDTGSALINNEITRNRWVWAALILCLLLLLAALYIPVFSEVLSLSPPGLNGWLVIAAMTILPWLFVQVYKSFGKSI